MLPFMPADDGVGTRVVSVTLPHQAGFETGDVLQLVADGTGELVEVQVPQGAGPGSVLQVEIPDNSAANQIGRATADERRSSGANNRTSRSSLSLQQQRRYSDASEGRSSRRASSVSEHLVAVVSGRTDLSDEEWYWLKVIVACTIWLIFLSCVLIFGGRATRKVKP